MTEDDNDDFRKNRLKEIKALSEQADKEEMPQFSLFPDSEDLEIGFDVQELKNSMTVRHLVLGYLYQG